jgi:site-specific DNA-methyltransferase (adenine-specific)
VQYVANSIKEFGFRVPIVIDSDNTIVCGHTRWKASKLLNMETVPCVVADDLTEEQIKAFRIADNKVSEMAGWDFPMLDAELAEIEMLDNEITPAEIVEYVKQNKLANVCTQVQLHKIVYKPDERGV